jgi:hypothetical protein
LTRAGLHQRTGPPRQPGNSVTGHDRANSGDGGEEVYSRLVTCLIDREVRE